MRAKRVSTTGTVHGLVPLAMSKERRPVSGRQKF